MAITEIERVFLIDNLKVLRKKLGQLDFKLVNKEMQSAYYLDFPDFRLFNTRHDFRFRYVNELGWKFKHGEISLSYREYNDSYSEVRDQISIVTEDKSLLTNFREMLCKIGMVKSFWLYKVRNDYSRSSEKDFRNELHIEIDHSIQMAVHPLKEYHKLQDTLQLCKETEGEKEAPEINKLMKQLKLTEKDIVTENYGERLHKLLGCSSNPNIKLKSKGE